MNDFNMIVEGFLFTDERMAQAACQEVEGIKYVRERLDMENPRMVLEMYHKLLAEQVFETPVGMMYLKELQDYLLVTPEVAEEEIEPIEVFERMQPFFEQPQTAERGTNQGQQSEETTKEPVQEKQLQGQRTPTMEEGTLDWYVEKLEESKRKERDLDFRRRRAEERTKQSHKHLRYSLLGSLFLFLVAVGMVAVTFMDQNPNIINYENRIIEKYQAWETDLENREQLLKEQKN